MSSKGNELVNFYKKIKKPKTVDNSLKYTGIPLTSRILVIGPSGSGKSKWVLDYISRCRDTFSKIIISTRDAKEPLYQLLIERGGGSVQVFENNEIPDITDFKDNKDNILVIFDDFITLTKKQLSKINDFAIRGRKCGITSIFQCQTYYGCEKIIRSNSSVIVIKKINSDRDLTRILKEYAMDLDILELKEIYKYSIQNDGVMTINIPENRITRNYFEILYQK